MGNGTLEGGSDFEDLARVDEDGGCDYFVGEEGGVEAFGCSLGEVVLDLDGLDCGG